VREPLIGALAGFGITRGETSHPGYLGLLAGNYGAAEYEALLGKPGPAQRHYRLVALAAGVFSLLVIGIASREWLRFRRQQTARERRRRRQGELGGTS